MNQEIKQMTGTTMLSSHGRSLAGSGVAPGARRAPGVRGALALAVAVLVMLAAAFAATAARAEFSVDQFGVSNTLTGGGFSRQAGAHADLTTVLKFVGGEPRTVKVGLPPGLIGNRTNIPTCTSAELVGGFNGDYATCPAASQVGVVDVYGVVDNVPVYNMELPADLPGLFAFNYSGVVTRIEPRLRAGDYGIEATVPSISQALTVHGSALTLWGVPADPSHDGEREGGAVSVPRRPFLRNPTSCSASASVFSAHVESWQEMGAFKDVSVGSDMDGAPFVWEGCERLPFEPSVSVGSSTGVAGAPTGLNVNIHMPQSEDGYGLASADVRKVRVTLPEGVTVSPSSAQGLGGCSPAQIGLGTSSAVACPDSSKLASVLIKTPLLEDPLEGSVYLASQYDNPFGSFLAMYVVAEGPGVLLKLPGLVEADHATGRLTATFDNNPQQPFSDLSIRFRGGAHGPLVNPSACGTFYAHWEATSWASDVPVVGDSPFTVDRNCDIAGGFAPRLNAGVTNPVAGSSSGFVLDLLRADAQQNISGVDMSLPPGLAAHLRGIPLCEGAQASAGTCDPASRLGSVSVLTGAGSEPLAIPQPGNAPTSVYLAGPYKGAPFSLVFAVPAQAGPFDLGLVVVRAALYIDPKDAHVRVVSDGLPQILEGVPLLYQRVEVSIDRPGFMANPTNCAPMSIGGTIVSAAGARAAVSNRFQVGDCSSLGFKPKLTASTGAKTSRANGTGLDVKITVPAGRQANLHSVKVELPKQLPSRLTTLQKACLDTVFEANPASCPKASIIGTAKAVTPILDAPLAGPAYFVSHGGAAFPDLEIVLQGEGVTVVLDGATFINKKGITSSTFSTIPDAAFSSFELKLPTGPYSALAANGNLCKTSLVMPTTLQAQNGARVKQATKIAVAGCAKAKKKKAKGQGRKHGNKAKKRG